MPDPVFSLGSNPPTTCTDDDALSSSVVATPAGTTSAPLAPAASNQSLNASNEPGICAVPSLVAKFTPPTALPPAVPATTVLIDRSLHLQHTAAGPLKGSDLQLGSVLLKHGEDNDAQLSATRGILMKSRDGYSLSLSVDALTARVNKGVHNDDGSVGGNVGLSAEGAGAEVTLGTPYFSITGGLTASVGASGSLGIRDQDHDGKPEYCEKFSTPAFTEGVCVEKFW